MSVCPCCGSPLTEVASVGLMLPMSKLERRIFDRLSNSFGKWVPASALVHACYWDDPDGGPDNAPRAVCATIRQLRKKVREFGMAIDWSGGRGDGERRLIWQDATPVSPSINTTHGTNSKSATEMHRG